MLDFEALSPQATGGEFDRPAGVPQQSRSVVLAQQGIVATSHPLAAQAGLDVLRTGGNAADAAIAANAMLGVVEPMSCGIGGDLFALYWDHMTQKLYGLNASGRSPSSLTPEWFAKMNLTAIPTSGPLSWSVPGCVSGWDELGKRFGSKPLGQLLAPAIDTAEKGFPVSEIIAAAWNQAAPTLANWPDSAGTYLLEGRRSPQYGEIFRNPSLAASYRLIANQGPDALYRGDIARRIVEFSRRQGGFLEMGDFAEHRADWIEPVSTTYRGYEVWQLPPNGQGLAVLQILNLLESFDLSSYHPGHPEYLHLLIEAKKLAYADRARFYADPAFADVPVHGLISKKYAAERVKLIARDRAAAEVVAGDPKLAHGDTVYLTVVDKDRNCCSLIQSIYYNFGSQVAAGDTGFALQNRGALFSLAPDHPNRLEPRKRPFHTIIPGFVTKRGKPWFCFGVMGGDMQPQGQVQVLNQLIDFGLNPQAAGDAARVQHVGSATPTGVAAAGAGTVLIESGISDESAAALRAKGHTVVRARGSFGGYQGILIHPETGVLHGASEPRKDGAAVGY